MNKFKNLLNEKKTVFGVFCKTNDPMIIGAICKAGLDFVILDNEHGPNAIRDTYNLVIATKEANVHPIVRVGSLTNIEIQRTLDLGISGIQIPQIQSFDDAKKVIEYTKFNSPEFKNGKRGVCKYVAAADFSNKPKEEYFKEQNEKVVNIIHIEGKEGVENFEQISDVEGIDVLFIGPCDLSASIGFPGDIKNPLVLEEIEKLVVLGKKKENI
jgi:4-hydroxy-2-oxoheptanedioate aldolase